MIPLLEELFGKGRIQPFNFTTDKQQGYELLREGLNSREIELPNYQPMITQLRNLNEKLKANSTKGKDDLADALMMACYPLMQKETRKFKVITYTQPIKKI